MECPSCKSANERGRFCSQCGHDMRKVEPAYIPDPPRQHFEGLRFLSGLLVLLGWLVIIGSVLGSFAYYAQYATGNGAIMYQGQAEVSLSDPNRLVSPGLSAVLLVMFGVPFGVFNIAVGQIIKVVLETREDVRKITAQ